MVRKAKKTTHRRARNGNSGESRKKVIVFLSGLLLAIAILVAGSFFAYQGLGKSDFFQVTSLKIEGCRRTSKKLILDLSGIDIHANLLSVNVRKVEARIRSHDWVESVEVDRQWPNRLVIEVKERVPVAITNSSDGLYYLDRRGSAFARVLPPEDMDYPVITGLGDEIRDKGTQKGALKRALKFIRYTSRGSTILPKQSISEIHLTEQGDAILFLVDSPFPIYLGLGDTYTKYRRLAKVLHSLYKRKQFTDTAYIRMDYMQNKVLVGLRGNA